MASVSPHEIINHIFSYTDYITKYTICQTSFLLRKLCFYVYKLPKDNYFPKYISFIKYIIYIEIGNETFHYRFMSPDEIYIYYDCILDLYPDTSITIRSGENSILDYHLDKMFYYDDFNDSDLKGLLKNMCYDSGKNIKISIIHDNCRNYKFMKKY